MAGIYLHIPFCKRACHYCNFHFSTSTKLKDEFLTALKKEIFLQKNYLATPVSTIYFGGGTPSLLATAEIKNVIEKLSETFVIVEDVEITLEANPDDIDLAKLQGWKDAGINRLSIGIQSFYQEDLQWMNRAHNASQATACIEMAQQQGFQNITIDLIYGTPTLTDQKWKANFEQALAFGIPHLSCYALTVEPKTALEKLIIKKQLAPVDPEKQARHFELLMQWSEAAGYDHYEVSNFAKPGFRSKHNSSYWQGQNYVGLGPSAHSFNGKSRQWNVANNALYIQQLKENILPFEIEHLTPTQQLNEYIMTSLRTMEGLSLQKVEKDFGEGKVKMLKNDAKRFIDNNLLLLQNNCLITTRAGKLLADGIASELFDE
jgi:oxygen-independent coproporphyrinogen III oxidase